LFEVTGERLRTVATDGHRLALSDLNSPTGAADAQQIIVPRKAVLELQRLLGNGDDPVALTIGSGQLQVDLDIIRLTTKLIDGRFPDYERVVPDNGDKRMQAPRDAVRRALARTAILSNEKFRGVKLALSTGKLVLQTHNPEHEEAEEELEVQYDGTPLEIGFNVNYLLDALGALTSDDFVMDLRNADASGLIQAPDDDSSRYVVMPMRL